MWQTSRGQVAKHPCWVQLFLQIQQRFQQLLQSPIGDILRWLISIDQTEISHATKQKTTHRICSEESSWEHCRRYNHRPVICHWLKDGRKDWEELGWQCENYSESKREEALVEDIKAINQSLIHTPSCGSSSLLQSGLTGWQCWPSAPPAKSSGWG